VPNPAPLPQIPEQWCRMNHPILRSFSEAGPHPR
jgi:hypothetical protein